jgi:hypothetical protein
MSRLRSATEAEEAKPLTLSQTPVEWHADFNQRFSGSHDWFAPATDGWVRT